MIDPNRLADLMRTAEKRGKAQTKFLTPAQGEEIRRSFGTHRKDVLLSFESGFEEAERVVAVFTNEQWGSYEPEDIISAIKITHREQDEITHRDILGAVLTLGITRESVGDIAVGEACYLVCLKNMAGFIAENLNQIGRAGVKTEIIPLDQLPKLTKETQERSYTVASLRFDGIVAAMFNISRGLAAEYILSGKAQLAHVICEKIDKEVTEGDIISVRGLGRAKLLEVGGQSRKGRIWIRYGRYV